MTRPALAKRKPITKPEIAVVMDRMVLGYIHPNGKVFTNAEMIAAVKVFGVCECGCGQSFSGMQLEWEHKIPNAILLRGAKVHWEAWRKDCHLIKTKTDRKVIAKVKRLAGETGQKKRRDARDKPLIQGRTTIQSRGFDKAPEGHSAWPKRKLGQRYKSNTRVDG